MHVYIFILFDIMLVVGGIHILQYFVYLFSVISATTDLYFRFVTSITNDMLLYINNQFNNNIIIIINSVIVLPIKLLITRISI